ncbi:MAG: hypothetical protein NTY77_18470 [Elusimicrobia bacterium]|nr:hypothetical protein [Elusimicrobiota bacterium]
MDTNASWEVWATRGISAASIVMLGYFLLFVDFSGHGRVWDKVAARVPMLAKIIPPAAASSATVVVKGGAGIEQVPIVDRTLIASAPAAPQPAAAPSPATAAAAPAVAKKAPAPAPHLTSSLTGFDAHSAPSQTSAGLAGSAAAAQDASAAAPAASAAAPQSAPAPAIAAKASYGATSRSEMMGQAAGPVYNFKGGSKKR